MKTKKELLNCQEDLKNWIINNWFSVEDSIEQIMRSALSSQVDIVDLDLTSENISEVVKQGILNVIDTYDDEHWL